jgi:hypothetical protein
LTLIMANRKEPAPLSLVLVTTKVERSMRSSRGSTRGLERQAAGRCWEVRGLSRKMRDKSSSAMVRGVGVANRLRSQERMVMESLLPENAGPQCNKATASLAHTERQAGKALTDAISHPPLLFLSSTPISTEPKFLTRQHHYG